jgi:hypothetical protein
VCSKVSEEHITISTLGEENRVANDDGSGFNPVPPSQRQPAPGYARWGS